jgi:hypothetical protein
MYTGSFGPASNRAYYTETIQLRASENDAAPIVNEIELSIGGNGRCGAITKKLSLDQIAYDEELGEFTFTLTDAEMRQFTEGNYGMGILVTIGGVIEQLFAGDLVVVDGVNP